MAEPGESQASEFKAPGASVNLVELFQAGENGIERRRTENLFKQLDERQLTEDEQAIIQQRVELQRKMFMEYERREKQRKMRELQEVCPDLDEEAARRALEACNWKEELAAERVSSDPFFLKRILAGGNAHLEHAPAPKPERPRSNGSRPAPAGPRPRLVDPSQVGAVFVGRFKSRLGPHQISAMGRQQQQQQQQQQAVAGAAAARRAGQGSGSTAAVDGQAAAPPAKAARGNSAHQRQAPQASSGTTVPVVPPEPEKPSAPAAEEAEAASGDAQGTAAAAAARAAAVAAGEDGVAMETDHGGAGGGLDEADGGAEGGGEEDDDEADEVDPNSADLSDNELHYEDDVLPVLSPLAGKRQRSAGDGDDDDGGGDPAEVAPPRQGPLLLDGAGIAQRQPTVPGQSPMFKYRVVAETSTGNVHSVATEEWTGIIRAAQGMHSDEPGQVLQPPAPGATDAEAETEVVQLQAQGGVAAPAEQRHASSPVGGATGGGARLGPGSAGDEEEVSSPATARGLQDLRQGPRLDPHPPRSGHKQGLQSQQQGHRPDTALAAAQEAAPAEPSGAAAGPVAAAAPAAAASRPRRAAAEMAAVLRQVAGPAGGGAGKVSGRSRGGRAAAGKGRNGTGAYGEDDYGDDEGSTSGGETGDDGDDSDFEVGAGQGAAAGGRSGAAAAEVEEATTSDDGEEWVDTEDDSDAFVAPGSRKRKAGAGGGGGRRQQQQQQPRKRATSGGSGARATRQRTAAGPGVVAAAGPVAAAGHGPVGQQEPVAEQDAVMAEDVPGPSGQQPGAPCAAGGAGARGSGGGIGGAGVAAGDDSEATVTEEESPGGRTKRQGKGRKGRGTSGGSGRGAKGAAAAAAGGGAISASGHTCRGRVKQKGVKRADLLAVGSLIARQGWYNAGYIFPAGFRAQTLFRSSVDLDSLTLHTCEILGESGQYWPAPTFVVTAADRPDEPLVAKSCTGCWTAVLRRINSEIEGRRAAGEDLPPPPKTAIAGPEYFGLNQPEICAAIEALDKEHQCSTYWDGKMDREAARGGQPIPARGRSGGSGGGGGSAAAAGGAPGAAAAGAGAARPSRPPRTSTGGGGGGRSKRGGGRRGSGGEDEPAARNEGEEDPEETYAGNRWSAVTRAERYRKRCEDAGEDAHALLEASMKDNPLPGFLDPITLEPVVNPAISPYGHVMGLATWKAVLAEHGRCPFTKQPLKAEALTVLTKNNIERYRSRIIQQ